MSNLIIPRMYKPNPDARIFAVEWPKDAPTGQPVTADEFLRRLPRDWRERGMLDLDHGGNLSVRTNQGVAVQYPGWFLIFGTAAEFYPVPPAIFTGRWVAA